MLKFFKLIIFIIILSSCKSTEDPIVDKIDDGSEIVIYNTSRITNEKLNKKPNIKFRRLNSVNIDKDIVFVNINKQLQDITGIGATISDASAEVFSKLQPKQKSDFLNAYFDADQGIGYSLLKTTIHSSEYSSESYTYIKPKDTLLLSFSLERDLNNRIPLFREIIEESENDIKIIASPYSPPGFMKNNNSLYGGGKLKKEFYTNWADYYVKYIDAYSENGIDIWGVTLQNESLTIKNSESCIFEAKEELDFLKNHLGPKLHDSKNDDVKVIVWNNSESLLMHGANTIFQDQKASAYAWGIGYNSNYAADNINDSFDNVDELKECYPIKKVLSTNFSINNFNKDKIESWLNAELYGSAIMESFLHGSNGFIDSNILLDINGGPNHSGRAGFSPIHADLENNKLIISPSYYYIGHFSKFIQPQAKRISSSCIGVNSIAFKNPDNSIVVVVMNQESEKVFYKLVVEDVEARIEIDQNSIQTLIF